ncbi:hypothetical protein GCM10007887_24750 [Methylobacterium haplocladii]|uniref:Uncharacterized protein n=1 Tax=Methylobacterium haplocladii TaxID=1176176 RepID=A0A512IML3_9HYPH|nr:hypothetical protein MHA02_13320 [Methylobacterium haplocladii]GLS59802.1 hypothetical protein GCM10007887_24750 [Methylobacterium haplocladii]
MSRAEPRDAGPLPAASSATGVSFVTEALDRLGGTVGEYRRHFGLRCRTNRAPERYAIEQALPARASTN